MPERRAIDRRKADVLAALESQGDVWMATANAGGGPHLIAVSCWWDGTHLVVATTGGSRTAANVRADRSVRLAAGTPSDAILIDAKVVEIVRADEAPSELSGGFAGAVGWDPREVGPGWVYFRLGPSRIQAYRGYDEIEGRDVMRHSRWLA